MNPEDRIQEMLRLAHSPSRIFPATIYYNEGWLLRLVIDWFSRHQVADHPLNFQSNAKWFSEALLPSQFFAKKRGDLLAEGWTHADGVIGHILVGDASLADTKLAGEATQFLVTEAKMFSPLSSGVTRANYFDQAARNVACMAEVLHKSNRKPDQLTSLGFSVLAPGEQIARGIFAREMTKDSIRDKVSRRVSEYASPDRDTKDAWYQTWFLPTLDRIEIALVSWEDILKIVRSKDIAYGESVANFYNHCLCFNRIQEREIPE